MAEGLVGRWDFDDGTGRDQSGQGSKALLGDAQILRLSDKHACLRFSGGQPLRIPVAANSPLAVSRGTFAMWLNLAWSDNVNVLEYGNEAMQFRFYRRYFQPRFRGEDKFKFTSGVIDDHWPKYDLREWAFYPHDRAAAGDSEWHHFAMSYDDANQRIIGWRDGEQISVVDLSATKMEPLRQRGLKEISTGDNLVGFLDDIRIYNRVLTDGEVREMFARTNSIYAGRSDTIPTDRKMEVYAFQEEDRTLYQAWLQHRPVRSRRGVELLQNIVAEGDSRTVRTAAGELADAVKSMYEIQPLVAREATDGPRVLLGTPETSAWIRDRGAELGIDRIEHDGFVIKHMKAPDGPALVVAAKVPAGVIFGTFDLIRRLQLGQRLEKLDVLENPKVRIRMVDHWSNFRGLASDDWYGRKPGSSKNSSRNHSIFSWEELRNGDTKLIRDWVRMLSSAGWNAISPSEINWISRNNFLDHLDEVETLAGICRDYGMKLYWSPNYLQALDPATADKLYARVPDFGGYVLKLGSEKQNGDPRPRMVNRIADTLRPHGGYALVRGFVYGNGRYSDKEYRNLIPYDVLGSSDGEFRDNVIIAPKGSPLDWDFSAPIPSLDGVFQKNLSGSELVIDKNWPASWVEKWKWWLEQDNYRQGPGSLNKFDVDCIMGVSMISPAPAWATSPLNMVNYYGLGRLGWNPDLSVEEIYREWICQTFGDDPEVLDTINTILLLSDDATRKLYMYRGYRGIWIDTGDRKDMVQDKSTHVANSRGIGTANPELRKRTLNQYAPGLRAVFGDPVLGEEFLTSFHFAEHDHRLTCGRTVIQDFYGNLHDGVVLAEQLPVLWSRLQGKVDERRYTATLSVLNDFAASAAKEREKCIALFETISRRKEADAMQALSPERSAQERMFDVRHFGAVGEARKNNAPAINDAITACAEAGGGTVFVPAGIYGCGTIHLKSNVTLSLDAGAVLKALPDAFDPWEPNPHDQGLMDAAYYHWRASMICGEELENVKILGPGTLDGLALTRSSKVRSGVGDKAIALKRCRNVEILNLNIQEGGHYAILASGCGGLRIDNVTIKTSRDGLNLAQCRDALVANCHINAVRYEDGKPAGGDDAIKLGSDMSLGATLPSENIKIENCYLASGCNALQFGTETAGDFRNISFENIRIRIAGKAGLGITANDGGTIENVRFKNIRMQNTFVPVFIKVSDVARVPRGTYQRGTIRNVTFENITATDCVSPTREGDIPSVIWGKPDTPIENIEFKNVYFVIPGGRVAEAGVQEPRENDERFPQDVGALPSHAWYIRNARDIRFVDCEFACEKPDGRPAVILDNTETVQLAATQLQPTANGGSSIVARNGAKVALLDASPAALAASAPTVNAQAVDENRQPVAKASPPRPSTVPDDTSKTPSQSARRVYEAENARLQGATLAEKRGGFSGTGYADFQESQGDSIEWTVRAESPGKHRLSFHYALKKEARPLALFVNGVMVEESLDFPSTGSWETWSDVEAFAELTEGENNVRLSTIGNNGGIIDYLRVEESAP